MEWYLTVQIFDVIINIVRWFIINDFVFGQTHFL